MSILVIFLSNSYLLQEPNQILSWASGTSATKQMIVFLAWPWQSIPVFQTWVINCSVLVLCSSFFGISLTFICARHLILVGEYVEALLNIDGNKIISRCWTLDRKDVFPFARFCVVSCTRREINALLAPYYAKVTFYGNNKIQNILQKITRIRRCQSSIRG